MKIFYVTNARLPTEKAHGLATVKLASAFAALGHEVTIFHPWRRNPLLGDVYAYYGVKRNFRIIAIPTVDFLWLGFGERLFFPIQLFSFSAAAALWLFSRYWLWGQLRDTVVFSHDHVPLFVLSFFARKIFYDIHDYPRPLLPYRRVLSRAIGLSVQTRWKIAALGRDFGIPAEKIVYWPNGTDVERFDTPLSAGEARTKLGLPQERKIVLYTGSLQRWKGVDTLVKAAEFLPHEVGAYIVGGNRAELNAFNISIFKYLNIVAVGQRPWTEIPLWLKAADVLVLPNTGREDISRFHTSPMKLFEYMASGRPIVASDIPSTREIADETMVFFAGADDPKSLAAAIQQALTNPGEAQRRATRSRAEVGKYTWGARAERILVLMRAVCP